jgi:hypothetical protein
MDVAATANAVSALSSGGVTGSIAVSLLSQANQAEQAQIATLFSSIGLGGSIDSLA